MSHLQTHSFHRLDRGTSLFNASPSAHVTLRLFTRVWKQVSGRRLLIRHQTALTNYCGYVYVRIKRNDVIDHLLAIGAY